MKNNNLALQYYIDNNTYKKTCALFGGMRLNDPVLKNDWVGRRLFLIIIACWLVLVIPTALIAQPKPGDPYIPVDKKLDPEWVESLFQRGDRKVYKGAELKHIAMPCGGIGAGQVQITGEGEISFTPSVYNQMQEPNGGHGLSTGYHYLNPPDLQTKIANSFSIVIKQAGQEPGVFKLSNDDFDDIRFIGEYPIAQLEYFKTGADLPVKISAEVFSPFVPLDLRSSANPVTVLKYSVTNTSNKPIDVSLVGWLKNITFPMEADVNYVNRVEKSPGITGVLFDMQPLGSGDDVARHPQLGGVSLSVLDENAGYSVASVTDDAYLKSLVNRGGRRKTHQKSHTTNESVGGSISSGVTLGQNETKTITFLISWFFPNAYEHGKRYKQALAEAPGWVGHIYNNWYDNSFEVAKYIASNFNRLYNETRLFRDTYFDNTLPYWLANRITMPVSTLAAGNVSIWQNGRMYAYEGVGFCQGTCGHVYNFVTAISRLFPALERSVRSMQDFSDKGPYSGYSKSGRINFRGYGVNDPNAIHSYASDAQSGYVLKAYREHLMSTNNDFLDSIWDKVKGAIGYQIFKDGAEIGLEPNGVLEGKQTFWDPMWYGPNPYNNTLYLAALRAAEEMALVMGEQALAKRYHGIFEKGRQYMNEKMWNGEYYVHLYPMGFQGNVGVRNGFSTPQIIDDNATRYIENFNQGGPNYYIGKGCDAQQLFGQNWAHQLGLGYILPKENCRIAANSIFRYNWTPDIATVYDYQKPEHRTLAAPGEGAMVNGSWPGGKAQDFENTHDKFNIWTGLEYEASCNMINEGHVKEGLIAIRAIHDRYNALKRNPWNEIEGSDHYSRAMHSWNVLLALSGFKYDGPAGNLGFIPRITPENFKAFFTSAEGWGNISQKIMDGQQQQLVEIKWGQLRLNKLKFTLNESLNSPQVKVTKNGRPVAADHEILGEEILISFKDEQILEKGQQMLVEMK